MSDRYPDNRTEAENKRYNVWAGNAKGNKYDPTRCAAEVSYAQGMLVRQCLNAPKTGPDNLYCGIHVKKLRT